MKLISYNQEKIVISIQEAIYSSSVIHKCFYWYSSDLNIDITKKKKYFRVEITQIPSNFNLDSFLSRIKKDLIDYNTREIINVETKDIRTLLIAKAFANNDDFDTLPQGSIEDTVGFTPFDFK